MHCNGKEPRTLSGTLNEIFIININYRLKNETFIYKVVRVLPK